MEALRAAELAADRPTRKGPVASSSTGMNGQRTGHGGPAGGKRVFGLKQISRIMFPARAMAGRQGAVDFGDIQIIATFGSLSLKQLYHMKKDIEIGEYAAPECVVVPVMMKETVLAVSGGQLDEEEELVF
jgi:hypothetical protein